MKKFLACVSLMVATCSYMNAAMVSVQWENDFPFDDDSDYTNGLKIEYNQNNWGIFVEQLMYSPFNIKNDYYVHGTHPYAGYLAVGADYTFDKKLSRRVYWLNYGELATGVVGKQSGAEHTQKQIHKVVGAHEPKGWDYQLHDEWEMQSVGWTGIGCIMLGHADGWNARSDVEIGGMLGTVQIAGGVNADVKFGYGCDFEKRHEEIQVRGRESPAYFYGLCGFEGRWWGWNLFLDGNRDGDSVSVDKEIWTCGLKLGLGAEVGRFAIDCFALFNTREYKTQTSTPNYMVFKVGYGF